MGNATKPTDGQGKQYHVALGPEDIAPIAFLPGDPERVPKIARLFDNPKEVARHREFVTWRGTVGGKQVMATNTGIGPAASEIVINELAALGVKVMIRVGTCGGLQKSTEVGRAVIADSAMVLEGTSLNYGKKMMDVSYPNNDVTLALLSAAAKLHKKYDIGMTASTDSFYLGQGRPVFNGYLPPEKIRLVENLQHAGVLCFEMESSLLFTIGEKCGIKTGAIFAVVANRATNEFPPEKIAASVEDAIKIAVKSVNFIELEKRQ